MDYFWILVIAASLFVEFATVALVSVWFAAGAAIAFISKLLGASLLLQGIIFVAASALMLTLFLYKFRHKAASKTNVDLLAGKKCIVTSEINGLIGKGAVEVNGQFWSAKADDLSMVIPQGAMVEILKVEGTTLIVRKYIKEEI